MKAVEFIRKFGWGYAIKFTNYNPSIGGDKCELDSDEFDNLKKYTDAYELVQKFGGLNEAKKNLESIDFRIATKTWFGQALLNHKLYRNELKQAITLVE